MKKEGLAVENGTHLPQPHYLHELSEEDEKRLGSLFKQLDVNGDGRIDVQDLSESLRRMGVHQVPGHAEVSSSAPVLIELIQIEIIK